MGRRAGSFRPRRRTMPAAAAERDDPRPVFAAGRPASGSAEPQIPRRFLQSSAGSRPATYRFRAWCPAILRRPSGSGRPRRDRASSSASVRRSRRRCSRRTAAARERRSARPRRKERRRRGWKTTFLPQARSPQSGTDQSKGGTGPDGETGFLRLFSWGERSFRTMIFRYLWLKDSIGVGKLSRL